MDRRTRIIAVAVLYHRRCQRRRHRFWVHPILLGPDTHREYHRPIQELRLDFVQFQRYFRLDTSQFDELCPRIAGQDTSFRYWCLSALGHLLATISFSYRVGTATIGRIVPEVAEAIFECLVDDFMPQPTKEDWKSIAEGFHHRWNFPNCLGSIDGKRGHPGSTKLWLLLLQLQGDILHFVDAYYRFRFIDVGRYGRMSDGGILSHSGFGHRGTMPYVLVGDEAFPLRRYLMRPFPGSNIPAEDRVFNYRLSRARHAVECSFGILSSQWRMYRRVIYLSPEKVGLCMKATSILHNFMRVTSMRETRGRLATQELPEETVRALRNVGRMGSNNATREALRVREAFRSYFNEEGAVPWQHQAV
ncbi:Protein ALP1-like [Merluccius polli]|uniref:Protein ALP1-like n=1 Tax=Merluccius polli TaxID=89951 RepID=A0AA47MTF0_MERPO|nr:Protein ALP1-like [Merluccius polli]